MEHQTESFLTILTTDNQNKYKAELFCLAIYLIK